MMRSAPPRRCRIAHEHGLGRTHRQRGAQTGGLAVGRHGHEVHFSATGGIDQLQRHLDAVAVGLVEDELAVALESVVSVEGTRVGRIGDLLDTDDDVHKGHILLAGAPVRTTHHPGKRGW
jgi:hypothetical protein